MAQCDGACGCTICPDPDNCPNNQENWDRADVETNPIWGFFGILIGVALIVMGMNWGNPLLAFIGIIVIFFGGCSMAPGRRKP